MTIRNSEISNLIEDVYLSKYGNYYFFKDFIVSEINEGVVFTWDVAQDIIPSIFKHYGKHPSICYITNRINNYSVNPADWYKFFNSINRPFLKGYAMVTYTEAGWVNSVIEKLFVQTKVENFNNLQKAIEWVKQINLEYK